MEVSHTGVNIAQYPKEAAGAFAIPNYNCAWKTLKKEPEKLGNVQGVYCSGHTLQLCIIYWSKTGQNTLHSFGCQESRGTLQKKCKGYSCLERETKAAARCTA
ncbi:hypothetical protein N1851_026379 [Merluccius polli]|uniref:Uncharacterized protein n=1 Tax=Merluccius polli TaxID=89951 RepID=A0AA47NUC3_MERPO|nr:hypothetical protein N1851_026379 [Merluccius polli]